MSKKSWFSVPARNKLIPGKGKKPTKHKNFTKKLPQLPPKQIQRNTTPSKPKQQEKNPKKQLQKLTPSYKSIGIGSIETKERLVFALLLK